MFFAMGIHHNNVPPVLQTLEIRLNLLYQR